MDKVKKEGVKDRNIFAKIFDFLWFFVLILIILPIVIVSCVIIYKGVRYPDKIPDFLGFKTFFIMDEFMDESVGYGDWIFTKNVNPNELKRGDIVAFRNRLNLITVHQIISIKESEGSREFTFQTLSNETDDTRYAKSENIEGILIRNIPKIGAYLFFLQTYTGLIMTILFIIITGTTIYMLAAVFDDLEEYRKYKKIDIGGN